MVYKRCCVPNCTNVKSYPNRKRKLELKPQSQQTFRMFKFPFRGDPQRARKWAEAIGKPDLEMKSSNFICSDHFRTEDYLPMDDKGSLMDLSVGRHCLGAWAIPSLFLSIPEPEEIEDKSKDVEDRRDAVGFFGKKKGVPCLICSMDCKQTGGLRSPTPLKFTKDRRLSSVLLSDQLWATFILRNVLKLEIGDYQHILERVGGSVHPAKWFVICRVCEKTLVQILDVYECLKKLERQMESLSVILKKKLQESMLKEESNDGNDKQGDDSDTVLNVREEIRRFLKSKSTTEPLIQPKEEPEDDNQEMMISDFDESWLPGSPLPPSTHVKEEGPLPLPIPITSKDSSKRKIIRKCPIAKGRQIIRKLKLAKTKTSQLPPPRKPRIRSRKKRSTGQSAICEICGYNALYPVDLRRHMQTHKIYDNCFDQSISKTHFFCNLCSPIVLFPTRQLLGAHKRGKHAEELNLQVIKCSECPETFLCKISLGNHLLKKHPLKFQDKLSEDPNDNLSQMKVYKCEKCEFRSLFLAMLKRHVSNTHESTPLICQHCSSSYKNESTLYNHMRRYHPELVVSRRRSHFGNLSSVDGMPLPQRPHALQKVSRDKEFPCKNCDALFHTKLDLKTHLENSHKDLFTFKCDMCDKSYLRASSLQTHKKINHLESGKKAKCGWCGRIVNHKTYLWTHMKFCQKKPKNKEGTGAGVYAVELDEGAEGNNEVYEGDQIREEANN